MPRSRTLSAEDKLIDELAKEAEAHMDDEPGEQVHVRIAKDFRNVFTFEIEPEELDEIAEASEAGGIEIDDFIRDAALARARGQALKSPSRRTRPSRLSAATG